jgi:hypothetical protein
MKRIATALLGTIGLCLVLPALADPPPWAPAHGRRAKEVREYRYVYYPAQQVYYAPEQKAWFWLNGGNWQAGVSLPTQFHIQAGSGVSLSLTADRPYVQHVYVEEHYGRPWREKHGHGHGGHEYHEHEHEHKHKHKEKHHKHHDHD